MMVVLYHKGRETGNHGGRGAESPGCQKPGEPETMELLANALVLPLPDTHLKLVSFFNRGGR